MLRQIVLVLALGTLLLTAGVPTAGSTARFTSGEEITSDGSLVVAFDEGVLKKYAAVRYRLDANVSAIWDAGGGQQIGQLYAATISSDALAPDTRGRVSTSLSLDISQSGGTGGTCTCGSLLQVEYADVTLTNETTGRTYSLAAISRDFD
jgi:hypothetical protein